MTSPLRHRLFAFAALFALGCNSLVGVGPGGASSGGRLRVQYESREGVPGTVIVKVEPGGAADRVGIRSGDRILALGGEPVTFGCGIPEILDRYRPGDVVVVRFERGGQELEIAATLDRPGGFEWEVSGARVGGCPGR